MRQEGKVTSRSGRPVASPWFPQVATGPAKTEGGPSGPPAAPTLTRGPAVEEAVRLFGVGGVCRHYGPQGLCADGQARVRRPLD